ncbi:MAG: zinc dependent phospholipase C family protein [Syntrophobacter sp.]
MPKERFHLLMADEYLKSDQKPSWIDTAIGGEWLAFFLGAISPDIFFYDLPFFSLGRLGDRLHTLMEREGLGPIQNWIAEERLPGREADFAWALGVASHFLADAIWHPIINDLCRSPSFSEAMGLSAMDCHRLIESEMEAFWLPRKSSPQAYLGLLKGFVADGECIAKASAIYRRFLESAALGPLPSVDRAGECYLKQNMMLRMFAAPALASQRDRLLRWRLGRYLGSLVVPARPFLHSVLPSRVPANRDPFSDEFMNEGFISLAARLSGFAERLVQSPPS